ncbi:MAG: 2Fe-2S iron-sulfur cluster-binding protein [Vicinamibacterales bacterium]
MDTVTLTIDGRQITVPKGRTVLQAAIESGIKIPYYCYHPALGVDGSCRVCIVKIEKMPKLQVSCSVPVAEGMVVHTQASDVLAARAGVFEFLLVNHPLDCPVCDKGGECPLQDFSYSFGPDRSRQEFARRTFDGDGVKADVDFGPTLMLNRNRCILCTRCVRFMKEVDGDAQINVIDRGYGSEVATFEEEGVHSLLSGNLMDVCPVGAITTRDYRFKSRPWDNPDAVDTICTSCAKGCNTTAWIRAKPEWAKGAQLARITPRLNPDVNGYFMCDIGRFGFRWVESDKRLTAPRLRHPDNALHPATWDEAMAGAAAAIQRHAAGTRFLTTAHASHEELFVFVRLAQAVLGDASRLGTAVTWTSSEKTQPARTKFKVPAVDAPNVLGARAMGLATSDTPDLSALRSDVAEGRVSTVYAFDPGPEGSMGDIEWLLEARATGKIKALIVQASAASALAESADIVLPGTSFLEKEAAYTNGQGVLQTTARVIAPQGESQEDWRILARLAEELGKGLNLTSVAAVRGAVAAALGSEPVVAGIQGLVAATRQTAETWLQASNPSERWKWDLMFQDLAPVKFGESLSERPAPEVIPLREVK